jgi:hypothetical protein
MKARTASQLIGLGLTALGVAASFAAPPDDVERFTVIKTAKVVTISGKDIEHGMIVLVNGKVRSVGRGLEYPAHAAVIDATDRVVMPGLIDPASRFGLNNYARGEVHGNWTVADEFFPAPDDYDELLDAGYTALGLYPGGGGLPGRALVVRTGGPAAQRVLRNPAYLRVTPDKKTFRGALEKAKAELEKVDKAREEFEKKQEAERQKSEAEKQKAGSQPATSQPATAAATQPAFQPPPIDPALQVLADLIQKKADTTALLELGVAADYLHYQDVLKKFEIAHQYLARVNWEADFDLIADQLGEEKAEMVLWPATTRVPYSATRQNLPRRLSTAGCTVSLAPLADNAAEHRRMLGRLAGLVRDGWTRDAALKSVTLHPAKLLGLDCRFGTIEPEREADFIFLDGDPLDPRARVREVMIAGEIVRRVPSADDDPRRDRERASDQSRAREGTNSPDAARPEGQP